MNTTEANAVQNDLSALVKRAELLQIKQNLDLQFKKNMAFFKVRNNDMYCKYANFTPTKQNLYLDIDNNINLVNIPSKKPAYNESADTFAKKQVEHFIENPTRVRLGFKATNLALANEELIHPKFTNNAIDEYNELSLEKHYDPSNPKGLIIVIGCGLGLQIKQLVENYDIRNILLFDRDEDSFYASLYIVDWENIVTTLEEREGRLILNIGETCENAIYKTRFLPYSIGLYNMTTSFLFEHTLSNENKLFRDTFIKESGYIGSYLGFFDDEQISFAHSINCINNNVPVFLPKSQQKNETLPPVFLIGNGPSLDGMVDLIKSYQDHVILISCGTSLSSLESLGITPDFHIEMERNYSNAQILSMSNSTEYLKSITLLCLNTVSPALRDLFKESYIALKPNDIGAAIYKEHISDDIYFELPLCNPTVTNCGLAYAVTMGFKDIYLLGVDFGMKSKKQHHSKHSFWSNFFKEEQKNNLTTILDNSYSKNQYEIPANFGGTVKTQFDLDSSRKNIELLISRFDDRRYYNPNDGALIKGTKTITKESIKIAKNSFNKKELKGNLISKYFQKLSISSLSKNDAQKKYLWIIQRAKNGLLLPEKCSNLAALHRELRRIFKNIDSIEKIHNISALLLKGSIQTHSGMLTYYCEMAKTPEEFQRCYKIGKKNYNALINKALDLMKEDPLRLDNTLALKEKK